MGTIYSILDALNLVLFAAGAIICLCAYRVKKNRGYLVLVAYFVLSFALFGIGRILYARYDAEMLRRARDNTTAQGVRVPVRRVELPIGPLLLVGGLWLIVKDTDAKESESVKNESN
ncbi:MAG: hypothetical protein ACYSR8_10860 [Planctomycetota bacterium]|jgi:branched-subunit amino acid ABC-type transport system permease component